MTSFKGIKEGIINHWDLSGSTSHEKNPDNRIKGIHNVQYKKKNIIKQVN